ncbi:MAG TPA: tRNA (guanosine(37)-N1)-methyltransferase TrmD [Alcanivorax sp.]|jgi:tRNA (guanine37-N1)-methyltransferase|nr:tRNA (guanosine(37)-N1)-methyltransferase TrmD [Alcanivorax sp.]MEA3261038.1 tRNA (guanosine(37)-N1)-methyltransferase TrmD [Pseudomonadota bacterium]HAB07011.1 tRNA (guanosine(37)-N1)-methyltransferase TrmD [Alcanivorax sp.]HAD64800.1 tRNA (guanosine(37)-N1)-methyltransferase TrmD [Alcanivorax sp.]HAI23578.1 tRNA (guanosine(37)-N1)-methyltransferase TrmD [Alcanivorax sp.]|tara:strand:- start:4468 stop:5253 length:786 start_codon:yes stop_codon:yes gene_type:complete
MRITLITLFPDMARAVTDFGVTRRAVENGQLVLDTVNPRDFTEDRHRTVDDRPFGGGPGMVMKVAPLEKALDHARQRATGGKVIYLSPQGRPLTQAKAEALAAEPELILLAGRYEGVDERLLEASVDEQISIGDYVLSGGELPALVLIDAVTRLLPGVLGHQDSAAQDSFSGDMENLLDCPHYTRPELYQGRSVPEVLLSGDHERIRRWRLKQALGRTWRWRPELLEARRERGLSKEESELLDEYIREFEARDDGQQYSDQ